MKALALLLILASASFCQIVDWKQSTLVKTSTANAWCHHCPDWNQTFYSFKLDDGVTYTARSHHTLDVTLNGHVKLRFEKDGHVGDYIHILDDSGHDRKLVITEKSAEPI
jgi:hypothetical protein